MSYCNARILLGEAAKWLLVLGFVGAASHASAAGYTITNWLAPIPLGDGAPNQVFGLSGAVDGDFAHVSELGSGSRAGVIRTYGRSGSTPLI